MKKTIAMFAVLTAGVASCYETCITNGYVFSYTVQNGKATLTSDTKDSSFAGDLYIPAFVNGIPVEAIGNSAFNMIKNLRNVYVEEGIQEIGHAAFYADGTGPTSVTLPSSVIRLTGTYVFRKVPDVYWTVSGANLSISSGAFAIFGNGRLHITALGDVPQNMPKVGLTNYLDNNPYFRCKREFMGNWLRYYGNDFSRFNSCINSQGLAKAEIVRTKIRENDPTIMDVVYKVTSSNPMVKVRVLAFEDGERSFAKVVRPETFIEGTAANVGDEVAANVEHTLSWQVSSDWQTRLAKLKFEVLASEGELLPMEWMMIPASDTYGKMKVSWNAHWESQIFDALLWLYADKNPGLTLVDGILKADGKVLSTGTNVSTGSGQYSRTYDSVTRTYVYVYWMPAPEYVFSQMGYNTLSGNALNYVNDETRLGLSPSGVRQYAYKIVGAAH